MSVTFLHVPEDILKSNIKHEWFFHAFCRTLMINQVEGVSEIPAFLYASVISFEIDPLVILTNVFSAIARVTILPSILLIRPMMPLVVTTSSPLSKASRNLTWSFCFLACGRMKKKKTTTNMANKGHNEPKS